eukprot:scaffold3936_cov336-Prasinococcus_capsulatus_cf.AAC.1
MEDPNNPQGLPKLILILYVDDLLAMAPEQETLDNLWTKVEICTRPDIAYLMHCLCKGMSQPTVLHMELAKRGLAYIKKTQDWGLYYTERSPLVGYTDSDWANDTENRKSITGYCFLLNGASIISYSKQQKNVATSSGAAEYMSASTGAIESRFIQQLLEEHYGTYLAV